jgi:hypothetical protein
VMCDVIGVVAEFTVRVARPASLQRSNVRARDIVRKGWGGAAMQEPESQCACPGYSEERVRKGAGCLGGMLLDHMYDRV